VSATPAADRHQFFIALDQYGRAEAEGANTPLPADLTALLKGPDVFSAAFVAAGWREAAIQLYSGGNPSAYPDWFAYGLGQDLRANRGSQAALDFLATRTATPDIELLRAEILMTSGKTQEALNQFAALASLNSPVGYRASYVLALADLDLKKYDDALARINLREGNTAEASKQYHPLAKESIEARVFLAHEAFDRKDWAEARRYTLELLELMPDQLSLRENLNVIAKAAAGK